MKVVLQRRRPAGSPARSLPWPVVAALAGAVAFVVVVASPAVLEPPPVVSSLSVENGTVWPVSVSVRSGEGDGWLPIGTVAPERTYEYRQVLDQGSQWELRFEAAGGIDVRVAHRRDELEAGGWAVAVPDDLVGAARAAGLPAAVVGG